MRARRQEDIITTSSAPSTSTSPRKRSTGGNGAPRSKSQQNGCKMEMYDHFYKRFVRPPMAPVYYPTAEEFADPIEYVAKIRPEAERYGVVKIVPPADFKPPFAINKETFTFRPRTQKLNEVEAIVKEKHTFIDRLINFNRFSGLAFEFPVDREGNVVDLYRLHRIVQNYGGCEEVNDDDKWRDVAREYLPKEQLTRGVPNPFVNLIRSHYNLHIEPFNRNLKEKAMKRDDESDDEMEELKHKYQHHHGTMRSEPEERDGKDEEMEEECPMSMQSGRRRSKNKKPTTSRRPPGSTSAEKRTSTRVKRNSKREDDDDEEDPMDGVYCVACNQGKDEELLLLCDIEGCSNGRHTYCCDPVLEEVPEGEWRCPTCIESEDAKIGLDWGFYDADTEYNLNSFTEFANKWKCDYFGVNDVSKISCDTVEREFWKNVVSHDNPVSVKYGADLITSRVGSGFPRKEDKHTGPDCKLKQQYANHAWNLNNMPVLSESVLSYFNTGISGMMVPWVYVGMCFSTFCWHTEDHWTYSVNYNHFGERKIWYGVGGADAEKFEEALKKLAPGLTGRQRDLFHHMTTAANPSLLRSMGVPIYAVHQNAGEFVITFPRAYHAGFNEGLNFAEAVNFAPIDWLAKGRQCVESYSNVRRYLVFSHDELLFKMVEAMDRLGLSTTLATHDELKRVIEKQKAIREFLSRLGVTARQMEQVVFEKIPDEQRSCRFCKTTMFMCALVCKHKRMTCVEHRDHLCRSCNPKDYKYQYRFDLDTLKQMSTELGKRTVNYTGWKEESDEMLEEEGKPKLERIEEFIDVAKNNKYPQTDQVHKLITIRHTAKSAIEKANQLLFKKVRTRTKTRCQRADTRTDTEGVRSLIEQMQAMDCNLTVIINKLEKWMEQIEQWRAKSKAMISRADEYSKEDFEKMIEDGDEYDIKLTELDELKKVVDTKDWAEKALFVTSWIATMNMEKDINFEYKLRYTSKDILTLIKDGSRYPTNQSADLVSKLQNMLSEATRREAEACDFLQNPSLNALPQIWQKLRDSDWFDEQYMNIVRYEVAHAVRLQTMIDSLVPSLSGFDLKTQFSRLFSNEIKFSTAVGISKACELSQCLKSSQEYLDLLAMINKMELFTERIAKLFKPVNPYHNLFEIVSERDDLTRLAENQPTPLYFQGGAVHPSEEWRQMKDFASLDQMQNEQFSLRELQSRIMEQVKHFNSARGLDACCCLGNNKIDESESTIKCLMCEAQFHLRCCEWSSFLQRLPQGSFLCVRCLRGQRPVIDDVVTALNGTPSGFLETHLVRNLIQKSRSITQKLMDCANKRQQGDLGSDDLCKQALFEWLSCEVLNLNGLPKAFELITEYHGDYLKNQISAVLELQRRPMRSKQAVSLFDPKTTVKRKRQSASYKECSKKTRKRPNGMTDTTTYYEEETMPKTCNVRSCLKPYGDTKWVMCEAGCKNWFHIVCVGFTSQEVDTMPQYRCSSCLDHADSPTSSVSTE